jgi:sulfatase modifying factor 1
MIIFKIFFIKVLQKKEITNLMKKLIFLSLFLFSKTFAFENIKIDLGNFSLNKYEITIQEFKNYAKKNNLVTEAEKTGGGYEWGAGWEKRPGWTYKTPYGENPNSELEPAVHISRYEAENYCKSINGRLPTFDECVTKLPEGINGLVAMGGNVWEWIDDQKNDSSLTAGASWWYGGSKTSKEGAQYKPSDFYAIYVGFRCAFN